MTRPGVLKTLAGSALLFGAAAAHGAAEPGGDAGVKAAHELLRDVSRAYSAPRSMTDEMSLTFKAPGMGEQTMKSGIRMAPSAVAITNAGDMFDIVVVDGTLYARTTGDTSSAVRATLGSDPLASARGALGMLMPYLPPHLPLKLTEDTKDIGAFFGMSVATDLKVAGHEMVDGPDGGKLHEVLFTGAGNGSSRVRIDPATKLIRSVVARGTPEGAPETMVVDITAEFRPKMVDAIEPAIAFATKDVKFHETLDDYMMASMAGQQQDMNPSIASGTPAPAFALLDQDGARHTLEGYRGKVVVLDWWGIW